MPTALVTGASAGLGAQFAHQLATLGHDLVLVARDAGRLEAAAQKLRDEREVVVEVLPADLSTDDGCAAVTARIERGDIDLLVNNAGIGTYLPFGEASLEHEEQQLDLNVRAVLRLTHAAVRVMRERGAGRVLNVSSVAGFIPRGRNATYAASKSWVTLFSEAVSVQLQGTGVTITAVCPGFTRTEFHERASADMTDIPQGMWLDAVDVVREGLADTFAGKPISVPSKRYKTLSGVARTIPRPVLRAVMARRAL